MVYPSFGRDIPKMTYYPLLLPSYGGEGECAYIWCNNDITPVTLRFENKIDRMMFDRLTLNILIAPHLLCENTGKAVPPCLYFKGYLSKDNDEKWKRLILIIDRWLIVSPFYMLDSELEILVDYSQTKQKKELLLSDFYDFNSEETLAFYDIEEKVDFNIIKSRYELIKKQNDLSTFPVVGIDVNSRQIEILTNACRPLCYLKCSVVFKNKEIQKAFFTIENKNTIDASKQNGEGPAFFIRGRYCQENNTFYTVEVITELK